MHGLASLFEIFIDKEGMSKGHSGKSRTADQSKIFTMNILTGYLAFLKAILLAFPRNMEFKYKVFRQLLFLETKCKQYGIFMVALFLTVKLKK